MEKKITLWKYKKKLKSKTKLILMVFLKPSPNLHIQQSATTNQKETKQKDYVLEVLLSD
jgi:hypothetical protein